MRQENYLMIMLKRVEFEWKRSFSQIVDAKLYWSFKNILHRSKTWLLNKFDVNYFAYTISKFEAQENLFCSTLKNALNVCFVLQAIYNCFCDIGVVVWGISYYNPSLSTENLFKNSRLKHSRWKSNPSWPHHLTLNAESFYMWVNLTLEWITTVAWKQWV